MTPEEIVGLIGNIANRPDIRAVQERQVKEIKALLDKTRENTLEEAAKIADRICDEAFYTRVAQPGAMSAAFKIREKIYEIPARQPGD
jgi:hypothetical protein